MNPCPLDLPEKVGPWTRPKAGRTLDSSDMFKYMNGGAELYLAYRFNHMKVYNYSAENQPGIVVEVYCMNDPDDAFGLLSLDWSGDRVELGGTSPPESRHTVAPSVRALYGRGLLRMGSHNIYARILASRETPQSREAVLTLGRAIAAGRKNPPEPRVLEVFPATIDPGWKLMSDRIGFLRSHMVLNSLYYLSHENILNLDQSAEAVTAPYEKLTGTRKNNRVQVLVVNYSRAEDAQKALERFREAYLPDKQAVGKAVGGTEEEAYHHVEDGLLGYRIGGKALALVFSCPDRETAIKILNGIRLKAIERQ